MVVPPWAPPRLGAGDVADPKLTAAAPMGLNHATRPSRSKGMRHNETKPNSASADPTCPISSCSPTLGISDMIDSKVSRGLLDQ